MQRDEREKARLEFIEGKRDRWAAGGYGYTIKCVATDRGILLKWTSPHRGQMKVFDADSRENREAATQVAERQALKLRDRREPTDDVMRRLLGEPSMSTPRGDGDGAAAKKSLRVGDVWLTYIRGTWEGIPDAVITGGRAQVRDFYSAMSAEKKELVPSEDYLLGTLQAMRRLGKSRWFADHRPVADIEGADWASYTMWRRTTALTPRGAPYSFSTIETDYCRLQAAIHYCMTKRARLWGGLSDPLQGAEVSWSHPDTEEIGEGDARQLLQELRRRLPSGWRAFAASMIAFESGRRIGAIGSDRTGVDPDGLRATDLSRGDDGRLHITYRAEAAKGEAYGQGDVVVPATRRLEAILRWLVCFHPNPLGPEHPLLWSPVDPTKPVSYAALNRAFKRAWKRAFDTTCPRGLAFHGFCRTLITTIGDELGLEAAAEYSGRTVETVRKHYKKIRRQVQQRTADRLDEVRGARPRKAAREARKVQRNVRRD